MNIQDIVVDTREQLPLWANKKKTLKTGDYSLNGFENQIAIERKSLADLAGSLGKGHERFRKELERSKKLEYFAIVIEGSCMNVERKEWWKSNLCKIPGNTLNKILFTLHVKHKINVFFARDRSDARIIIQQLLSAFERKTTKY